MVGCFIPPSMLLVSGNTSGTSVGCERAGILPAIGVTALAVHYKLGGQSISLEETVGFFLLRTTSVSPAL